MGNKQSRQSQTSRHHKHSRREKQSAKDLEAPCMISDNEKSQKEDSNGEPSSNSDKCPICLEWSVEPLVLACGHSLCKSHMHGRRIHRCPFCRQPLVVAKLQSLDETTRDCTTTVYLPQTCSNSVELVTKAPCPQIKSEELQQQTQQHISQRRSPTCTQDIDFADQRFRGRWNHYTRSSSSRKKLSKQRPPGGQSNSVPSNLGAPSRHLDQVARSDQNRRSLPIVLDSSNPIFAKEEDAEAADSGAESELSDTPTRWRGRWGHYN